MPHINDTTILYGPRGTNKQTEREKNMLQKQKKDGKYIGGDRLIDM